ncbi:beta/alpha barrel domain-containing protein [Rhizosphaericola mali]|uniref:Bifunctional 4-hydroxy-2-oxoglutarate aldolase/2-dehydro-3-deoxy-phosphogluconate aldolase n=1 Tax=Rhizosphaericola mali TaxID=2545455 RepID=A0A5P2G6G8_9BACT|nr:bifunctional 4-hydroxy-2-oxoglutarate aldolase/2-dehydro-3-deoxy-phosphogluconate aldolase [Rhizosphaericola mali]QES88813.1 bifunctional 4-hydroxy-2-oxoglutarate aldolase/2-dehydro-3-deoxy-phosphogluconate aldolase [Rhizosphaericola mali]
MNGDIIVNAIIKQGMLPLFYHDNEEISIDIVRTLYKEGVRIIEYTNRGRSALSNFKKLKEVRDQEMKDLYLGIGTIKVRSEAESYIEAGADFIVAPIINPVVATIAANNNVPWIPGCMTPSEINEAQNYQAKLIKIFPANILGPEFISSIKELFPGQLFMPTGGVSIDETNIKTWFQSGVCAVGMGSKLISKDILENKNYEELATMTRLTFNILSKTRP